jgi:hypothetical protein
MPKEKAECKVSFVSKCKRCRIANKQADCEGDAYCANLQCAVRRFYPGT